ncbi:MAG: methyltransferase domain-containing protein [Bacteriovoracaceae bacterium]
MKRIIESSVLAFNLSKTLVYSIEYRMLYGLSKAFSFAVRPPRRENDKELIEYLKSKVISIHKKDASYIADGIYPAEVIIPKAPKNHLKNLPRLLFDSLKVSRRRKLNKKKDLEDIDEVNQAPDYLKRNYHFQTDGYFSDESAKLYEHQVEVLFSGTAAPMRRMLIKMIKDRLPLGRPLKILELGAGVGTATVDFAKSFDIESYTVSDISGPYLELAKKRLSGKFEFVKTAAEDLPFKNEEFDLIFSVYLFHEIPRSVRLKILDESARVLKKGGMLAICDSIQKDDDPKLNLVVDNFPKDYHEPFYKDYTLWDAEEAIHSVGLKNVSSQFELLSKYWTAFKV